MGEHPISNSYIVDSDVSSGFRKYSGIPCETGESGRDDVDEPPPGLSVEGSDVVPDRGVVEPSVVDAVLEDVDAEVVPLDVSDGAVSEDVRPEASPADSSEQSQLSRSS